VVLGDSDFEDGGFPHEWEDEEEDLSTEPIAPRWRKPLLIGVSALIIVALVMVPVYNALTAPTVADNGLEVCGFDYCIVEEAVRGADLELEMSSLYNELLDDEEAVALARLLTDHLGVDPVGLSVVDSLEGRLGGVYDPATRSIEIERPARAWTVLHEVAHVMEGGHGQDFQEVLIELTRAVSTD
jgi:hypothetical protein